MKYGLILETESLQKAEYIVKTFASKGVPFKFKKIGKTYLIKSKISSLDLSKEFIEGIKEGVNIYDAHK